MIAPYWQRKVYEPEHGGVGCWVWYKMQHSDGPDALSWNVYSLLVGGQDVGNFRSYATREEAMSDLEQELQAATKELED